MNCEQCQELLNAFLDNELPLESSMSIETHLTMCSECSQICFDMSDLNDDTTPKVPDVDECLTSLNSNALWLRINNTIETEVSDEPLKQFEKRPRGWRFSFSQAATAVVAIALISSLLTVVGIRNYLEPAPGDLSVNPNRERGVVTELLTTVGLVESPQQIRERKIREHQAMIDYWNNRVQQRREQWNDQMRLAFDRNLNEIDQAVHEYTIILQKDPDDALSGEMLDSALNEKMNLLRQFSEL